MRFIAAFLAFLAAAAPAAGQIIFPDVITSSRADGKLVDLGAIQRFPAPIVASQCVMGTGDASALQFGPCGTGDITAVVTPSGSGLTGGANSGTVTLNVDPSGIAQLGVNDLTGQDRMLIDDVSDGTRRLHAMTVANFGSHLAGDNTISSNSEGELTVGATIARDSELPNSVDLGVSGNDLSISISRPGRSNLTDTVTLPTGGGTGTNDYDALLNRPVYRVAHESSIPQPSAATNGRRYQTNNGELFRVEDVIVAGTDRVVSFTAFPADTTSTSGFRFQGGVDHFSDLPDPPTVSDEGKWWFVRSTISRGEAPFILIDSSADRQSIAHSPEASHPYVGAFDSMGSAQSAHDVTAAGQLAVYPVSGTYDVYEVGADFVAGTPDHHTYGLRRQDVDQLLMARISNLEAAVPGTFVALTDTPDSITASQCVRGNVDGDALEFAACGTGGGSFDLWDDVSRSETLLGGTDRFLFGDDSAAGDPNTYITFSNLSNQVRPDWRNEGASVSTSPQFINCVGAGIDCTLNGSEVRIGVTATGDITGVTTATNSGLAGGATSGTPSLSVDVSNLPSFTGTVLHRADQIIVRDDSDTTEKRMSLNTLFSGVAGDNLTWDATNTELDVTGVGDIEGVTAGSGISGGGNSGTVTVTLDIDDLPTQSTVAAGDVLAFSDDSDSNDRTEGITVSNFLDTVDGTGLSATGNQIFISPAYRLPASPSTNDIAQWDGSAWTAVALPSGTATPLSDGTPTAVILSAGSAGSSNSAARSSHTHQLDSGAIARLLPTASSVGEVPRWNGTTWGLTTIPSASSATPFSVGISGESAGTNSNFSRSDHDHELASSVTVRLLPTGASDNQIAQWNGSAWVAADPPSGTGSGDIEGVTAGVGISGGGTSGTVTVTLDLDELTAATPVAADELAFVDTGETGDPGRKVTIANFFSPFLGDNLTWDSTNLEIDAAGGGGSTGVTSITEGPNGGLMLAGCTGGGACVIQVADGEIDIDMLTTAVAGRLLPTGPADDQIARYDSGTSAWVAEDLPAGGGGAAAEVLFDNTDSTETALAQGEGALDWGRRVDIDLGRALVAADDDKWLRGYFNFTQNSLLQYIDFEINAGMFRGWTAHTATSGNSGSPQGYEILAARRARSGDIQASMTARLTMVYRRVSSGNDVISMQIATDGSSTISAISDMRGVVHLLPDGGSGGAADGVVTAGVYDSANTEIDFTVADPGTDFSVDVSALATASSGDITAVNTPAESGLAGGATSGAVNLSLNVQGLLNLGLSGLAANDDVIVADGGTEYQVTLANLSTYALSRIDNLSDLGTPDVLDKLAVVDNSDSGNPKDLRLNALSNWLGERLAGDNLTWDSTNGEIDAAAGGSGTGDITAVTTDSASGLSGGADTGSVALQLDIQRLNERTAAIVGSDSLAFVNVSETGSPTRRATFTTLFQGIAGDNLTWDSTNNELDATGAAADGVINSLTGSYSSGTVTFTAGTSTGGSVSGSVAVPALGGDITAVTTAAASGLAGGADEGSVALTFDPDGVPTVTSVASDDRLVIVDESVSGDPPRTVTPQNFFQSFDGNNLSWDSANNELDVQLAANPGGSSLTELTSITIGSTSYAVAPGANTYRTGTTTYDATNDRLTATAVGATDIVLGDAVLFQIPADIDTTNTDALELRIEFNGSSETADLLNADQTAVTPDELFAGLILEAFLIIPDGTNRNWVLIEPTDLTTAQVQSTTSTHFGLVSGQRLSQAIAPWARFSPSGIAANDCLKGNAAGDAVEFGTCATGGGGGGDITAVTAGAGLGGGGDTGAVTLTLNIASLTGNRTSISNGDEFAVTNDGVVNDPTQPITWAEIIDELGDDGYGLGNGTAGELNLDFSELDTETSIAQSDFLTMLDTSDSTDPAHRITLQSFIDATAGNGLGRSGGDFALSISELTIDNTYAAGDFLVLRDISDTVDENQITLQNFCNRLAAADSNMSCNTNAQLQYSATAFGGIAIEDDGSALGSGVQTLDLQGNVTVAVSGTQADLAFPFVDDRASLAGSDISINDQVLVHSATHDGDRKVLLSALRAFINSSAGDITGVTAGAGLTGGGTTGAVTLAFDIDSLPEVTTLDGSDTIPIEDETDSSQGHMSIDTLAEHFAGLAGAGLDSNDLGRMILDVDDLTAVTALASDDFLSIVDVAGPDAMETDDDGHTRKITIANFVADTAGTGLDRDGENFRLDIDELTTQTSLQGTDEFAFADASQTDNRSSNATLATIAAHLAGGSTLVGANATGQLTLTGVGDILGITTTAGASGLSGGCTSGTCSLAVAPFQLPQLTALDSADWIIVGDNSDSQTPKRIAVSLLGNGNGGIDVGTNGLVIDIPEVADFSSVNDSLRNGDTLLFYDESANGLREITWNQFMADTFRGQGGLGLLVANSQPRLQLNWDQVSSDTPVGGDYLGFHDISESDDHFKRITLTSFLNMLAASDSIHRDGTGLAVQDDSIDPAKMEPPSGDADDIVGQVMMIGTGGDPEWAFPFEFPRVRLARDVSTTGNTGIGVLAATIHKSTTSTSVSYSAPVVVTRTAGTGSCIIRMGTVQDTFAPLTVVVSTGGNNPKEATMTISGSTSEPNAGFSRSGTVAYALTLAANTGGVTCEIDSGEASLTLSTS